MGCFANKGRVTLHAEVTMSNINKMTNAGIFNVSFAAVIDGVMNPKLTIPQ